MGLIPTGEASRLLLLRAFRDSALALLSFLKRSKGPAALTSSWGAVVSRVLSFRLRGKDSGEHWGRKAGLQGAEPLWGYGPREAGDTRAYTPTFIHPSK